MSTEKTFYDKFLAAQKAMPKLTKDGENPHYKSSFITLDNLLAHVLPVLNEHGLMMSQGVTTRSGVPALKTMITDGADTLETTMLLMTKTSDPQGQGSAITYARRYSLMAMLGLSAGEDDDGEKAQSAEYAEAERARQQTSPTAVAGFYSTLKGKGVTEKDDATKILDIQDPNWRKLNTSGIIRMQKALDSLQPDTIKLLLEGELI